MSSMIKRMTANTPGGYILFLRWLSFLLLPLLFSCESSPTSPPEKPFYQIRGMTLTTWSKGGYHTRITSEQLRHLRGIGVNHIMLIITVYQSDPYTAQLRNDPLRTPTLSEVKSCAEFAIQLGLAVTLKPQIDLDNGDWRGTITPHHPSKWFEAYRDFLIPLAQLSESLGADRLIIGTELAGTLRHQAHWQEIIQQIRTIFSGRLTYAASWDETFRVPFWKQLDDIGVNFYFPVTRRSNASRLEMLAGWQPWLSFLERLHHQTGRPIILTEIGYRSIDGAGIYPYDYTRTAAIDLPEQADLYWAAFEATRHLSWLKGLYWWYWSASGSAGSTQTDYTPTAKPAEQQIITAWRP